MSSRQKVNKKGSKMESLGTGLIVLGVLGFLVSLVALIVALVRKKKKKLWLLSFVVFLVLAIVGGSMLPTTEPGKKIKKPPSIVKSKKLVKKKEVKKEVLEVRVCPKDGTISSTKGLIHQ